jgi:DNA-binding NtrC family response regulator
MNILVRYIHDIMNSSLNDLKSVTENNIFLTNSDSQAIKILNENEIEKIILELDNVSEISFLDYINKYFPEIPVVVITDNRNETILSVIRQSIFNIIEKPFDLEKLLLEIS